MSQAKQAKDKTKVLVRKLPPAMTEETFRTVLESVAKDRFDWVSYYPGKVSLKRVAFSRAYINFLTIDDVLDFKQRFDGHVFISNKGNQYKCAVEYAPLQKVPKLEPRKHPLEDTIDKDADYIRFLELLESGQWPPVVTAERPAGSSEMPSAASVTAAAAAAGDSAGDRKVVVSRLMEYLAAKYKGECRLGGSRTISKAKQSKQGQVQVQEKGAAGRAAKAASAAATAAAAAATIMAEAGKGGARREREKGAKAAGAGEGEPAGARSSGRGGQRGAVPDADATQQARERGPAKPAKGATRAVAAQEEPTAGAAAPGQVVAGKARLASGRGAAGGAAAGGARGSAAVAGEEAGAAVTRQAPRVLLKGDARPTQSPAEPPAAAAALRAAPAQRGARAQAPATGPEAGRADGGRPTSAAPATPEAAKPRARAPPPQAGSRPAAAPAPSAPAATAAAPNRAVALLGGSDGDGEDDGLAATASAAASAALAAAAAKRKVRAGFQMYVPGSMLGGRGGGGGAEEGARSTPNG